MSDSKLPSTTIKTSYSKLHLQCCDGEATIPYNQEILHRFPQIIQQPILLYLIADVSLLIVTQKFVP